MRLRASCTLRLPAVHYLVCSSRLLQTGTAARSLSSRSTLRQVHRSSRVRWPLICAARQKFSFEKRGTSKQMISPTRNERRVEARAHGDAQLHDCVYGRPAILLQSARCREQKRESLKWKEWKGIWKRVERGPGGGQGPERVLGTTSTSNASVAARSTLAARRSALTIQKSVATVEELATYRRYALLPREPGPMPPGGVKADA